jgi:hypothetical protein
MLGDRGSTMVKVLRYKSEGRWFDPRWCLEFFIDINPFDRTMALGWTLPLTEMSTGVFPGAKCGCCVRLTTLPPYCAIVKKSGNLNFLETSGPPQACNGTALPFLLTEDIRRMFLRNTGPYLTTLPSGTKHKVNFALLLYHVLKITDL